jgi:hypothetical protein
MSICYIPVSIGELYDKYSILQIKKEKLKDNNLLSNVEKEINLLETHINKFKLDIELYNQLKQINEELWEIEDNIREKESNKEFDSTFIELARSVYHKNDRRAYIKQLINKSLKSDIVEVKYYKNY